jgi:GR25 family glycosyltransferase involved in LPS biosynthesis
MDSSLRIGNLEIHDSVCISLIDYPEKREQVITECAQLSFKPKFHTPVKNKVSGVHGCLESHIYCIEYAKRNNLENILIMEDDVIFDTTVLSKLDDIILPESYDMIYLGYHGLSGYRVGDTKSPCYLKLTSTLTTHAYIIHSSIYDYVLDSIKLDWFGIPEMTDLSIAEEPFFKSRLHAIDVFYAKWVCHRRNNSFGIYPMICYQRPGMSDIEGQVVNYTDLFKFRANILAGNWISNVVDRKKIAKFNQLKNLLKLQKVDNKYDCILVYTEDAERYINSEEIQQYLVQSIYTTDSWDILWLIQDSLALVRFTAKNTHESLIIQTSIFPYLDDSSSTRPIQRAILPENKNLLVVWAPTTRINNYIINEYIQDTFGYIVKIIKQNSLDEYRNLPPHELVIADDLDFFVTAKVNSTKTTLYMTSNEFSPKIPFVGTNFLHNLQGRINRIIFKNETDIPVFRQKFHIDPKYPLHIKKGVSDYPKKMNNTIFCDGKSEYITDYLEWYSELIKVIEDLKITVFNSEKKYTINGISYVKGSPTNTGVYQFCFCNENIDAAKYGTICIGIPETSSLSPKIPDFIDHLIKFIGNDNQKQLLSERLYQLHNSVSFC